MKTVDFIRKLPFFESFNEEQLKVLVKYLEPKHFSSGDILLKQGNRGNELFIIKHGTAEISVFKPGDIKRRMANTQIGNCYGEVSMLSGDIITASITAIEPIECYSFKREKLLVLRLILPHLASQIERAIAQSTVNKIQFMIDLARDIHLKIQSSLLENRFHTLEPFSRVHRKGKKYVADAPSYNSLMNSIPLFSEFSENELTKLFGYCEIVSYEKGAMIEYTDQPSADIVCSGVLQIYGETIPKISFVGPGFIYGQLAFFNNKLKLSAFCREDSTLMRFNEANLNEMEASDYSLWAKFNTIICSQVVKFLYDVDRLILRLESEG